MLKMFVFHMYNHLTISFNLSVLSFSPSLAHFLHFLHSLPHSLLHYALFSLTPPPHHVLSLSFISPSFNIIVSPTRTYFSLAPSFYTLPTNCYLFQSFFCTLASFRFLLPPSFLSPKSSILPSPQTHVWSGDHPFSDNVHRFSLLT